RQMPSTRVLTCERPSTPTSATDESTGPAAAATVRRRIAYDLVPVLYVLKRPSRPAPSTAAASWLWRSATLRLIAVRRATEDNFGPIRPARPGRPSSSRSVQREGPNINRHNRYGIFQQPQDHLNLTGACCGPILLGSPT